MKLILTLLLMMAVAIPFQTFSRPDTGTGTIIIEVTNLRNSDGAVLISLFDNEEHFPKDGHKAAGKSKATISNGKAVVKFTDMPYGTYAVAILHDENENLKMDFNLFSMPKEGYGFSNNAKGNFGPPGFSKAAFELNGQEMKITIATTYFLN